MKIRLSTKTNLAGETHFYLDDSKNIVLDEKVAEYLWHKLNLPSEDDEYQIEIKKI